MSRTPETILADLTFPEGPRWRDGHLWFSDFYTHSVIRTDLNGEHTTEARVEQQPSGLGWDAAGRLLVVSMIDRRLLRRSSDGRLESVAELGDLADWHCNDMVVGAAGPFEGHAWIGNFGFDLEAGAEPRPTGLIHVAPDGTATRAADDLLFPNGTVITPDHGTLIVAETFGRRLTAFRIADDGSLHGRSIWADLDAAIPDGICLDAEGAVWVADPRANECLRVTEGGRITDRVSTGDLGSFACTLGGDRGNTLLICAAAGSGSGVAPLRSGRILAVEVETPASGSP